MANRPAPMVTAPGQDHLATGAHRGPTQTSIVVGDDHRGDRVDPRIQAGHGSRKQGCHYQPCETPRENVANEVVGVECHPTETQQQRRLAVRVQAKDRRAEVTESVLR